MSETPSPTTRPRRTLRQLAMLACFVVIIAAGTAAAWSWWLIHQPYRGHGGEARIDVRPGQGAGAILHDLAAAGVLPDARLARAYLVYILKDPPLKAGEYTFDAPLSTPEVLDKLVRGEVMTHPFTLLEGLTLDETAEAIAAAGFGSIDVVRSAMADPALVNDLDPDAPDLEGYLFPDTYHFARGTDARSVVSTLVRTFRQRYESLVATPFVARDEPKLGTRLRDLVILASVIEKEALLDEERPIIAGLYANRLRRGIALYADPTIIFAIKKRGDWDGNLRKKDLRYDSPYNTYLYPGLPPGPICSPGLASLLAAATPADVPYLYFVSRNDGTHVFSRTLSEHNRNVDKWQRQYWRKRWAEERRSSSP